MASCDTVTSLLQLKESESTLARADRREWEEHQEEEGDPVESPTSNRGEESPTDSTPASASAWRTGLTTTARRGADTYDTATKIDHESSESQRMTSQTATISPTAASTSVASPPIGDTPSRVHEAAIDPTMRNPIKVSDYRDDPLQDQQPTLTPSQNKISALRARLKVHD